MRMNRPGGSSERRRWRGLTLTEVLIAAVILAVCVIPVISIFITGKSTVVRTDSRRKYAFYLKEIYARINRTSLHTLWNYYGPKGYFIPGAGSVPAFGESGRFRDRLAEYDPVTKKLFPGTPDQVNPLGFTEDFLDEMALEGFEGQAQFEFFTKKGLGIDDVVGEVGKPHPKIGIMHMQAGWAHIQLVDIKTRAIVADETESIMCPAIVGRPGLKLSSCPAISPEINTIYATILRQHEAAN